MEIKKLPKDDRYWRLDWLGEVSYPGEVMLRSQPSVKVYFSPLRVDPADSNALLAPEATELREQMHIWLPVGMLGLFGVGDLWQNCKLVSRPSYQRTLFERLEINSVSCTFIKSGLSIEEHFLLPLGTHPWHRQATHSYCVMVQMDDGRRLIIPCLELIRFYFGSSNELLHRLFTRSIQTNDLWHKFKFDTQSRHLHVHLAKRIKGPSAADIGRIALSDIAKQAAMGIHYSGVIERMQSTKVYIKTGLPFAGKTDLQAQGVWLPFGQDDNQTFLVYQLLSCSHPFPYNTLSYETDKSEGYTYRSPQGKESAEKEIGKQAAQTDNKLSTKEAGKFSKKVIENFLVRDKFPDLNRKPVWAEKIGIMDAPELLLRQNDGALKPLGFGEGNSNTEIFKAELLHGAQAVPLQNPGEKLPSFVRRGIQTIQAKDKNASVPGNLQLLKMPDYLSVVQTLPTVINEDGEIDPISLCESSNGQTHPRRACFVEVRDKDDKHTTYIILEHKQVGSTPHVRSVTAHLTTQQLINLCSKEDARRNWAVLLEQSDRYKYCY